MYSGGIYPGVCLPMYPGGVYPGVCLPMYFSLLRFVGGFPCEAGSEAGLIPVSLLVGTVVSHNLYIYQLLAEREGSGRAERPAPKPALSRFTVGQLFPPCVGFKPVLYPRWASLGGFLSLFYTRGGSPWSGF